MNNMHKKIRQMIPSAFRLHWSPTKAQLISQGLFDVLALLILDNNKCINIHCPHNGQLISWHPDGEHFIIHSPAIQLLLIINANTFNIVKRIQCIGSFVDLEWSKTNVQPFDLIFLTCNYQPDFTLTVHRVCGENAHSTIVSTTDIRPVSNYIISPCLTQILVRSKQHVVVFDVITGQQLTIRELDPKSDIMYHRLPHRDISYQLDRKADMHHRDIRIIRTNYNL
jgi:hypothetical protein